MPFTHYQLNIILIEPSESLILNGMTQYFCYDHRLYQLTENRTIKFLFFTRPRARKIQGHDYISSQPSITWFIYYIRMYILDVKTMNYVLDNIHVFVEIYPRFVKNYFKPLKRRDIIYISYRLCTCHIESYFDMCDFV